MSLARHFPYTGPGVEIRQGTVTAVGTTEGFPTVDVAVGGDTENPTPGLRHLASYVPTVGDTVWLVLLSKEDGLVLGKLAV